MNAVYSGITFDGQSMRWSDVQDVRFGTIILQAQTVAGPAKGTTNIHEFAFRDGAGKTLRITFQAGFTQKGRDGVDADCDRIIAALEEVMLADKVAAARRAIGGGPAFGSGKLRIDNGAYHIQKGILFWKKTVTVPAAEVRGRVVNGYLELLASGDKPFASLKLISDWNAVVLQRALGATSA